jgi:hypothetical protein
VTAEANGRQTRRIRLIVVSDARASLRLSAVQQQCSLHEQARSSRIAEPAHETHEMRQQG